MQKSCFSYNIDAPHGKFVASFLFFPANEQKDTLWGRTGSGVLPFFSECQPKMKHRLQGNKKTLASDS